LGSLAIFWKRSAVASAIDERLRLGDLDGSTEPPTEDALHRARHRPVDRRAVSRVVGISVHVHVDGVNGNEKWLNVSPPDRRSRNVPGAHGIH